MGWFEDWQQDNRKRFPNAANFFDEFSRANEEIRADVIDGAVTGVAFTVAESVFNKKIPGRSRYILDSLLGAGYAAGSHFIQAASGLIKDARNPKPDIDASILAYADPTSGIDTSSIFHHSLADSLKANPVALQEIGTSIDEFDNTMFIVINNEKPLSEKTVEAIDRAIVTLPAKRLMASLNRELDQMQIKNAEERERYVQTLSQVLEKKSGLTQQYECQSSVAEKQRLETVKAVVNKEIGLNNRLNNTKHSLKNMAENTKQAIADAKRAKSQMEQQRLMKNFKAVSDGFQFVQCIGELTGNSALQKAGIVGQASYKIISELSNIKCIASAAGCLSIGSLISSISVIGMAGCMIMKLFSKKKPEDSASSIIMKQLKELSQQMAEFRNEVMQQFMQLHRSQKLIYDAVCQGFNLIYFSIKSETEDLKYSVISRLEDIQSHLLYLERQCGDGFRQLSTQSLLKTISSIEREVINYEKNNTGTITKKDFKKWINELTFWLVSYNNIDAQCKIPLLTGEIALPQVSRHIQLQQHDYKRILNLLSGETTQLGQVLGFLLPYAQRYLLKETEDTSDLSSFKKPFNLEIWSHVVKAYVKLRKLAAESGIAYDQDNSELNLILQDADNLLEMLAVIQKNRLPIFSTLTEEYNQSLEILKSKSKEEVARILREELMKLGETAIQLPLQGAVADVQGASIALGNAAADNITIPAVLMLAQRVGLGTFVFNGARSRRIDGSVRRHSKDMLGVSGVYPSAHYIIDIYFAFNNSENRIHIATAERYIQGAQDDTNPGDKKLAHVANANFARVNATNAAWMGKPIATFFNEMWTSGPGLTFQSIPNAVNEQELQQNLEAYILQQNINIILDRDAIKNCLLRINFIHALAYAYAKIIGDVGENIFAQLPYFKNSEEIEAILLSYLTVTGPNLALTTVDTLVPTIELEFIQNQSEQTDQILSLQSPLAYPIIEQISELSSLFVTGVQSFNEPAATSSSYSATESTLDTSEQIQHSSTSKTGIRSFLTGWMGSWLWSQQNSESSPSSSPTLSPGQIEAAPVLPQKRKSSGSNTNPAKQAKTSTESTRDTISAQVLSQQTLTSTSRPDARAAGPESASSTSLPRFNAGDQ